MSETINPGEKYTIKSKSDYFKNKYGIVQPMIIIEGLWKKLGGKSWMVCDGNPACLLFAIRSAAEKLSLNDMTDDKVYYGHIGGLGELVCEKELEEVNENGKR